MLEWSAANPPPGTGNQGKYVNPSADLLGHRKLSNNRTSHPRWLRKQI